MTTDLDVVDLSRWQFGITTVFHYIFVPLTIGLASMVAIMQAIWQRTGHERWYRATRFFGNLFLINFAMGVVTGIVQEFQFGMNWSESLATADAVQAWATGAATRAIALIGVTAYPGSPVWLGMLVMPPRRLRVARRAAGCCGPRPRRRRRCWTRSCAGRCWARSPGAL